MIDIAKHIRIFSIDPDDDFVTKRTVAIKSIDETFSKTKDIEEILGLANKVAKAVYAPSMLDTSIVNEVEKALKKQSPAFVSEGEDLQIAACALIASLQFLERTTPAKGNIKLTVADVFALGCYSALSFQPALTEKPKVEALRNEMLTEAKRIVFNDSFTTRSRLPIVEFKTIASADDNSTLTTNIVKAIAPVFEKFQTNAVLDREEIDILWWRLNNWSNLAEKKYSSLNNVQAGILKGIELAELLRRMPHQAHYHLATDDSKKLVLNANELLEQIGGIHEAIKSKLNSHKRISDNPEIFPLFNKLINKNASTDFSDEKRTLKEWVERALLEGTLINLGKFLNDGN